MTDTTQKGAPKVLRRVVRGAAGHWVGDGFPVRTLFAYPNTGVELSPFLLLDYAAPKSFPPSTARRGVGAHPHRGFETVTIVYQGEVEHRDSAGHGGRIGPGDVQWMSAASGVMHEEFHGDAFTRQGGVFEVAQLWVNLPGAHKMQAPSYQDIREADIPTVEFSDGNARARIIAGDAHGRSGPARTATPMHVWDLQLKTGSSVLPVPSNWRTALVVLNGRVRVAGGNTISGAETAIFQPNGDAIEITADTDSTALLLAGEPINEPIVGHGPFVMNTEAEIRQAIADFQA